MEPSGADDTIFALATPPGRGAIAIVRVSGARTRDVIEAATGRPPPPPRVASLRRIRSRTGDVVDQAMLVFFGGPSSYTGEDLVEFHLHGGIAILEAFFEILRKAGVRPAEPGEFTRRAVENGKFDLTQAEAIADLVDAETEAQRKQAISQYGGALVRTYERWRENLVRCIALAEAAIDFSDEELPGNLVAQARARARNAALEIQQHLSDGRRGEILRNGLYLTVIGPPNAGKSSLVNALAKRDVAIVSDQPGTTRDVIEVHLDLGGYPVIIADTAGLRESAEPIESEGVRRALARARDADLVLLLLDGANPTSAAIPGLTRAPDLVVWNKADLPWQQIDKAGLRISAATGQGLSELIDAITLCARAKLEHPPELAVLTRERHRRALEDALAALTRAGGEEDRPAEFVAEDLRLAVRAIGRITGTVDVEDVLDQIFREFCIGK